MPPGPFVPSMGVKRSVGAVAPGLRLDELSMRVAVSRLSLQALANLAAASVLSPKARGPGR